MHFGQMTEIVIAPGVDLVGPLPNEVQGNLTGAIGIANKNPETANRPVFMTESLTFYADNSRGTVASWS